MITLEMISKFQQVAGNTGELSIRGDSLGVYVLIIVMEAYSETKKLNLGRTFGLRKSEIGNPSFNAHFSALFYHNLKKFEQDLRA